MIEILHLLINFKNLSMNENLPQNVWLKGPEDISLCIKVYNISE